MTTQSRRFTQQNYDFEFKKARRKKSLDKMNSLISRVEDLGSNELNSKVDWVLRPPSIYSNSLREGGGSFA